MAEHRGLDETQSAAAATNERILVDGAIVCLSVSAKEKLKMKMGKVSFRV